ncbi:hypothetical protein B7494_g1240 [Chlorociboria aeruginascens]|nr:hypothetical protein B7494_g1240 [Chlorociboria aeruginascens]
MSDSSDLSSAPSEDEMTPPVSNKDGILKFFPKVPPTKKPAPQVEASPPRPKREPSPPHEYVLADNPDIAFIVMFRSRFTDAFQKSLPNFGPQELERDIVDTVPGEQAEQFLCALLGLLLNRKQDVKAGHYNRALEEAVQTHKSQWAKDWESKNPLSGGATFTTMSPTQRLTLLRTLILWSLSSSDSVKNIITTSYKQARHEDDLNQQLSVQPWGSDGDKRRYFLVEGLDDTHFRVYRESNHTGVKRSWWSVAGDIDELKQLAEKLAKEDGGQKARTLSSKMLNAVPRFEATEEKRKRREYRQARKQQFKRPEPNFSMYEGRTRGKRMKYTYSDEEDEGYSDATTSRRSTRTTGTHTPAEGLAGPTVTLSGRQVKSRIGGTYGESMLSGTHTPAISTDVYEEVSAGQVNEDNSAGRPRRAATSGRANGYGAKPGKHIEGYNSVDEMDDDEDDASEQDYGDDEDDDDHVSLQSDGEPGELTDEDEDMGDGLENDEQSLIVKLPVKTPSPDRKTTIKLHLSPQAAPQSTNMTTEFLPSPAEIKEMSGNSRDTHQTLSSLSNGHSARLHQSDAPAKPTHITVKSPSATPLSPSLAYRRSPEKPATLLPSLSGYSGS